MPNKEFNDVQTEIDSLKTMYGFEPEDTANLEIAMQNLQYSDALNAPEIEDASLDLKDQQELTDLRNDKEVRLDRAEAGLRQQEQDRGDSREPTHQELYAAQMSDETPIGLSPVDQKLWDANHSAERQITRVSDEQLARDTDSSRFAELDSNLRVGYTVDEQTQYDQNNGHSPEAQQSEDDVLRSILRGTHNPKRTNRRGGA